MSVAAAARTIPAVRLEMSRTLGLSAVQRWVKVGLPSLTPGVLLGVRVASAMALIVTLLVDIFGTGAGIGRLLIQSQQTFDAAAAWGLLLIVGAFGYLASMLVNRMTQNSAAGRGRARSAEGDGQIMAIGDTLTPISHAPASSRLVS